MPQRALITGVTGQDGSYLAEFLLARDYEVHGTTRRVDAAAGSLWFHTDLRSPKFEELSAEPRLSLLGYDRAEGLQIRIEGRATLHRSGFEQRSLWDEAAQHSRIAYRRPFGPLADCDDREPGGTGSYPDPPQG